MSEMGRPTVMTDLTVKKLEEAFAMGCTDLEACCMADISKQTLYTYQKKNPDFVDRKERLKQNPFLVARQSIITNMNKDGKLALDYMKHKRNDEFNTKQQVDHTTGGDKLDFSRMSDSELAKQAGLAEGGDEGTSS